MKKKPYRILIKSWIDGTNKACEVMAETVKIPGFEKLNLIVHRHPTVNDIWHVSDADTGALIEMSHIGKKDAIKNSSDRLNKSTMKKVVKAQRVFIKKFGKLDELPPWDKVKGVIA